MPRVYTEPLLDKNEKPPVESHIDFTSPLRKDKEKPEERQRWASAKTDAALCSAHLGLGRFVQVDIFASINTPGLRDWSLQ